MNKEQLEKLKAQKEKSERAKKIDWQYKGDKAKVPLYRSPNKTK
jgi:hypothetical protein